MGYLNTPLPTCVFIGEIVVENLTLEEMSAAYQDVVHCFGDVITTEHKDLSMLVKIKSDCNDNDNTGIIFDQNKMAIYETEGCCEACRCKSSVANLLPVIKAALVHHRMTLVPKPTMYTNKKDLSDIVFKF